MTSEQGMSMIGQALRARMPRCDTDGDVFREGSRWTARIVVVGISARPAGEHRMTGPTKGAAVGALAASLGVSIEEGGR